jgi:L-histidine N-alpha-methyltransferase
LVTNDLVRSTPTTSFLGPTPPPGERRGELRIDILLGEEERVAMLRAEARRGLTGTPKQLPPKWFYDERGSALFDEITRLPEYYLTRREREILVAHAREIATLTGASSLVELGSGTSEKTRLLLDALLAQGTLRRFVPFDVCLPALEQAAAALTQEYPGLSVHAVTGDFHQHVSLLPRSQDRRERRLVAFLGSTIGNFDVAERAAFLQGLRRGLGRGDWFLLGADLVKDRARLDAAYNDAAGVTVAFNKNVLRVLNRDLDADFDEQRFDHQAAYDPARELVDIRLRAREAHRVRVRGLRLEVAFAAGEELRTEISTKFTRAGLEAELGAAGFSLAAWWTDRAGDFSLSLWRV